jgi:uncharacterized damage-inducible protein DinB
MKTMKSALPAAIAVLPLVLLLSFGPRNPHTSTDQMLSDWERAKTFTREYLDAATEDTYSFKPSSEMRSFGEQMLHLAEANYGLVNMINGTKGAHDFGTLEKSGKYKTKAEVTQAVMDSYDYVISSIKSTEAAKMSGMVKVFNAFDLTREVTFAKAFEHQTHHRGQATVYLRLKGITPPQEKLF